MSKRYYSLREYYKDFPKRNDLSDGLANCSMRTNGYIEVIEIAPTEEDKIRHREVLDFIKKMEEAEKRARESRLRVLVSA